MEHYRDFNKTDDFIKQMEKALGVKPEAYYAIFFMDGDNMGAWLTGGNDGEQEKYNVKYQVKPSTPLYKAKHSKTKMA
jgi:CRISPR/Cas system-associated protein Cas10 (large subunit of type III CRISPR-Cas system)